MKVTALIQARMGSTRLPGKTLAPIVGQPLIWHVINRIRHSYYIDSIVLATTTNWTDDILADWSTANNILVFRGSEQDVLGRLHSAAARHGGDILVRITADDPFKDPEIIDRVIELLIRNKLDFAYNNNPPTFPEGLDTEVFTIEALRQAHHNAGDPFEREHVTQHFYRNPSKFRQANLAHSKNLSHLRWTIDEQKDLEMACQVYEQLNSPEKIFLMQDILDLLEIHPQIAKHNTGVKRSGMYQKKKEEK